jgi:diadenosine tetraphosphate (Ap4A) HIT family hydrolase
MENLKSNPNSHLTAKERDSISFPAKVLLNKKLFNGSILDFGSGFGKDVELIKAKGFDIVGYDPYYLPNFPTQKFDTIICFYVLNVLLPEEQVQVLMEVSSLLNENGKAYFAVRRDLQYEGYRIHKLHKKQTYQCNIKLPFKSIFKNDNCEIYEYQHYTFLNKGNQKVSPFFMENDERKLLFESATAFSFYDKYPVSLGHSLVVPKRLVANYFELSLKEQTACWIMVNKVKQELQKVYNPNGFNVGININQEAGQTIPHCHIHIIPRYKGDVEKPRGGVRGVIPSKKEY